MAIGYIWTEELFREDNHIVYKVRSLNSPNAIAFIKVGPTEYKIFKAEYELNLIESLTLYKLAGSLLDDYFRYSS